MKIRNEELHLRGFLVIKDPVGGSATRCLLGMYVIQGLKTVEHLIKPPVSPPNIWRGGTARSPRELTLVPAKSVSSVRATGSDTRMSNIFVQPLEQSFHPDLLVVPGLTLLRWIFFSAGCQPLRGASVHSQGDMSGYNPPI